MNDIPDWAVQIALKRCGIDPLETRFIEWRDQTYAKAVRHLAQMIAKHEQPPVDPDEEAVKRIFDRSGLFDSVDAYFERFPHFLAAALAQYKQERSK